MDKALKQRLKRKKQDVVIMRGKNRLTVIGA